VGDQEMPASYRFDGYPEESTYEDSGGKPGDRRLFHANPRKGACPILVRKNPRLALRLQLAAQARGNRTRHYMDSPS